MKKLSFFTKKFFQVFDALIQFEREVGTMEELDRALEKVNSQIIRISSRPQKKKVEKSKKRKTENGEDVEVKKRREDTKEKGRNSIMNKDEFVNGTTEIAAKIEQNTEVFSRRIFKDNIAFLVH